MEVIRHSIPSVSGNVGQGDRKHVHSETLTLVRFLKTFSYSSLVHSFLIHNFQQKKNFFFVPYSVILAHNNDKIMPLEYDYLIRKV